MKNEDIIPVPDERIISRIHLIHGEKVMLDSDLAELYGVTTGRLNEAVKRNSKRFPQGFMFQLNAEEAESLISQIAISKKGRGGRRKSRPYAFTEQGVAMLSSVLRSERAIQVNIVIITAFVRMRKLLETNHVLREKLAAMERQLGTHSKAIQKVYSVLQKLTDKPEKSKGTMGFKPVKKKKLNK